MSETAAPEPGGELPPNRKRAFTWTGTRRFIRTNWFSILTFILASGGLLTWVTTMTELPSKISYLFHPNSLTSAAAANADLNSIVLHVKNIGREPSYLQTFLWDFGELPIEKEPLVLVDPQQAVIERGADVNVRLKVSGLASKLPRSRLEARLGYRTTTLWVDVRESNNPHHQLSVPLPVDLCRNLILAKVPEDPEY